MGDSTRRDTGGRVTHAILELWVSPTVSLSVTGGCGLGSDARSEGRPCLLGCPLALPGRARARVSGVTRVKPGVARRVFPRVLLALRGARQRCSGRSGAGADPRKFRAAIAAARVCHEQAGRKREEGKKICFFLRAANPEYRGLAFCLSEASTQQLGFSEHQVWAGRIFPRLAQRLLIKARHARCLLAEGREEVWVCEVVPGLRVALGRCQATSPPLPGDISNGVRESGRG